MRGFTSKAAAFLLAQAVWASSMPSALVLNSQESVPTAHVTLRAPLEEDGTHVLSFRLDLQESDQACGYAKLKLNGQSVAQNATGGGTGAFTILDGSIITASWDIACHHEKLQILRMTIHSVNGKALAHTTFSASFRQTGPVVIKDVWNVTKVKYTRIRTTETERILDNAGAQAVAEQSVKDVSSDYDIDLQLEALEDLKSQARELREAIIDTEDAIMDQLVYGEEDDEEKRPLPAIPLRKCRDLTCAFNSLAYEIRHAHGHLCEDARGWRAFFGCAHGEMFTEEELDHQEDEDEDMHDIEGVYEDVDMDMDFFENFDYDDDDFDYESYIAQHYRSSTRIPLIMLVAETAVIFGTVLFVITATIRRCVTRRRSRKMQSALPLFEKRYSDFPEKSLFQVVVVEKADAEDEKHSITHDDDDAQSTTDTTVSEELCHFREAASLVSDLVAVSTPRQSCEDCPPAYESQDEDYNATVTNGSRYTPKKQ